MLLQFATALTPAIWDAVAAWLLASPTLQRAVFAPGRTDVVQQNYVIVHDKFIPEQLIGRLHLDADVLYRRTGEFEKKWNLAIYYQLRFGDACKRVTEAVETTIAEGWIAAAVPAADDDTLPLSFPLFQTVHAVLDEFFSPKVLLRPLTHRFVRGAVQIVGRVVAFVQEGVHGKVLVGAGGSSSSPEEEEETAAAAAEETGAATSSSDPPPPTPSTQQAYKWCEREHEVAAVAWELSVLETWLRHAYVDTICAAAAAPVADEDPTNATELRTLVADCMADACQPLQALVDTCWSQVIGDLLTQQCSTPLAAVKGVAATYRMTNRPPPTQASPFVHTILRPVQQFATEQKIPERIGAQWKHTIVVRVAERYATAVADLLATIQRTEQALKNRRGRRQVKGGLSDGEKVKLQLYWDVRSFTESVEALGLKPQSIVGVTQLEDLTTEGKALAEPSSTEAEAAT